MWWRYILSPVRVEDAASMACFFLRLRLVTSQGLMPRSLPELTVRLD